jgi:hypothetical protein
MNITFFGGVGGICSIKRGRSNKQLSLIGSSRQLNSTLVVFAYILSR